MGAHDIESLLDWTLSGIDIGTYGRGYPARLTVISLCFPSYVDMCRSDVLSASIVF